MIRPTAAPMLVETGFELSEMAKRKSAVSHPSRRTAKKTTDASPTADPAATALATLELADCEEERGAADDGDENGRRCARPDDPEAVAVVRLRKVGEDDADDERGLESFPRREERRSQDPPPGWWAVG